jgi:hypothetical protein
MQAPELEHSIVHLGVLVRFPTPNTSITVWLQPEPLPVRSGGDSCVSKASGWQICFTPAVRIRRTQMSEQRHDNGDLRLLHAMGNLHTESRPASTPTLF